MRFAYCLCALSLIAGCGDDTGLGTNNDMASATKDMSAAQPDLSMTAQPDLSMTPMVDGGGGGNMDIAGVDFAGVQCGQMTCGMGEQCCVSFSGQQATPMCATTCADGGVPIACDGPEDCSGNPCCLTVQGGMFTMGAMCTQAMDACPPMINVQSQSGQTRLCHIDDDCTRGASNTQLPLCCTIMQNGNTAHICLNKLYAGFIGGTCP